MSKLYNFFNSALDNSSIDILQVQQELEQSLKCLFGVVTKLFELQVVDRDSFFQVFYDCVHKLVHLTNWSNDELLEEIILFTVEIVLELAWLGGT